MTPQAFKTMCSQLAPSRGMYRKVYDPRNESDSLPTRTLARDVSDPLSVQTLSVRSPNSHPRAGCIEAQPPEGRRRKSPNSHPRAGCIYTCYTGGCLKYVSQLAPSRGMYPNIPGYIRYERAPNSHPRAGCIPTIVS